MMTTILRLLALLCLAGFTSVSSRAQDLRPNQIDIQYGDPKIDGLKEVRDQIVKAQALEKVRDLLAPIRLPRRLLIKTEYCDGVSNAWYEEDAITVCYEYLDDIWRNAPKTVTPAGVAPIDALVGPMIDVFLHEAGHAVFDILNIPLFGREEDAADQFSNFIMLKADKADARRLIQGNAYQYKGDLRFPVVVQSMKKFADVHGTPSQRYYNLLCLAYGADPELFGDFLKQGHLPADRAEGCEYEYKQVANAFQKLIDPYIDEDIAKGAYKTWLPAADKRPARRSRKAGWR